MQLVVVVLGTLIGLLLWDVTVQRCAREAAEELAARLERRDAVRKRWVGALRDLVG